MRVGVDAAVGQGHVDDASPGGAVGVGGAADEPVRLTFDRP